MNLRQFFASVVLIILLISAGCTQIQTPATVQNPTPEPTVYPVSAPATQQGATKEEMVAFVKEAVAFARQNGKERSLAEFSNKSGSFFRGVLYIYAYDVNGTTIAHPVNPEKIGVNRLNEKDVKGNLFIQDLRQAAINGTGFATYYYINPTRNNAMEKKLGYAMTVDDAWWLGSGIYLGPANTPITPVNGILSAAGVATDNQG